MEVALKRRTRIINQMETIAKFTYKIDDKTSFNSINTRLANLNDHYKAFNDLENELLQYASFESIHSKVDEIYYDTRSMLEDALDNRNIQKESKSQDNLNDTLSQFMQQQKTFYASVNNEPNIKLPKLNIEPFSGDYVMWPSFKDLFVTAVHSNTKLSGSTKLQLLKGLLRGEAASLIRHITTTDENYEQAWEKLDNRYNKPKPIISKLLQEFLEQKPVNLPNHKELRRLYNRSDEIIRSLRSIDKLAESRDIWLIHLIVCKMDNDTKQLWAQESVQNAYPTFEEFLKFLNSRCDALESCSIGSTKSSSRSTTTKSFFNDDQRKAQKVNDDCYVCNNPHLLFKCPEFRNKTISDRLEVVKEHNLCYNCLRKGHSSSKCSYRTSCFTCRKKHHTMLHLPNVNSTITHHEKTNEKEQCTASTSSMFCQLNHTNSIQQSENTIQLKSSLSKPTTMHKPEITHMYMGCHPISNILPTALVKVQSRSGNQVLARVLLDSGSQSSFITESFIKQLGLARENSKIEIHGLSSISHGNTKGKSRLLIQSRIDPHYTIHVDALIVKSITGKLPSSVIQLPNTNNLRSLGLADPMFYKPNSIEILLGVEFFFDIIENERLLLPDLPPLQQSKFGWLVAGNMTKSMTSNVKRAECFTSTNENESEFDHDRLNQLLRRFWEIENLPTTCQLTDSEMYCEQHFTNTTTITPEGRFEVRLPFISNRAILGDSYNNAKRRLLAMERRFHTNHELRDMYTTFMKEYIEMNHMKLVNWHSIDRNNNNKYFIPHHAIFKESTTTQLRVVFDASCKTSTSTSLNDIMHIGPKIQSDLLSILLRFRQYKFVFVSDVEKMYRQIMIHRSDANYQLVLWRNDPQDQIKIYQLLTVTYGMNCSPYLAVRCLKKIAEDNKQRFPQAANVILNAFYMDDALFGADSEDEAIKIKSNLVTMLRERGLNLRKWRSNSQTLLESFDKSEIELNPKLIEDETSAKTLGIVWDSNTDKFSFRVKLNNSVDEWTKRKVLSEVSRVYDPMGFVAPSIMIFKIMLQKFWVMKLDWDSPLPIDLRNEFELAYQQLNQLNHIEIPRWYYNFDNIATIQLHAFCDSSEKAYGCVVYTRAVDRDGNISTNMVCSKGKVAPIQQVSLPRLELCGAHLLAKTITFLKEQLNNLDSIKVFAWTDSTTVLKWLSDVPRRWKTFIANRTSLILGVLPRHNWNHVPSKQNPADLITRGVLPQQLCFNEIWWKGPPWLRSGENCWPIDNIIQNDNDASDLEMKTHIFACVTSPKPSVVDFLCLSCSSWFKLKKVVVYVLRYVSIVMKSNKRCIGAVTTEEMNKAEKFIVKNIQSQHFYNDISDIQKMGHVKSKSTLSTLDPILSDDEVLRVGGRLRHAELKYSAKHPVILPKNHRINQLIIQQTHSELLHGGTTLVLNTIRQKYWMISARQTVKSVLNKCVICIRHRGETIKPKMGDLPTERVTQFRPFMNCGIDYAGPVMIKCSKKRNASVVKAYLAVFVCLSTKAVHLEVVTSIDTDSFLAALRRFVGRRGIPDQIWCDNGSNFVGGNAELKHLFSQFISQCKSEAFSNFCLQKSITFKFIPPSAPNFGGLWESVVKSTKFHLKRVMANTKFTYEELSTLIIQIESILNSRPLCRLNDDVSELQMLTPSHFLIGENITAIPEPSLNDIPDGKLNKWQNIQKRVQGFWRAWQHDYLNTLQTRNKWKVDLSDMREGQVVILREDNLPPNKWLLGRVLQVYPGGDGVCRVVKVKTASSEFLRPVNKLIKLPVADTIQPSMVPEDINKE